MLKKLFVIPLLFTLILGVLVGCKPEDPEDPVVEAPKVNSVSVSTNDDLAGSLMVHVVAVDDDAMIYYVVIANDATIPTAEEVKAGVNYGSVTVLANGSGTGALLDKPDGLEGAVTYKVAIVLEKNDLFSDVITRSAVTLTVDDTVDKGDGTELNPFWIETVTDLEKVGSGEDGFYRDAHYVLKNDLDLGAAGYGPDGMSWTPIGRQFGLNTKFSGVFDGNGYTIDGLYLRDDSGTEKWGFFYEIDREGVVKNINLTNVDIQANGFRIGGIAGYSKGLIFNVSVVGGIIEGTDAGDSQVGGIVGSIYEMGTIKKAFTNVTVKGSGRRVAGIAGSTDVAGSSTDTVKIEDCYSVGPVIGTAASARQVGGIVGYSRGTEISNVYSSSTIIGASQVGGLIGFFQQRSETTLVPVLENSFYMGDSLVAFGEYNSDRSIGRLIGESSSSNGEPTLTNLWGLDTAVLGDTFGEFTNVDGTDATAANFADNAWFTTNLSSWNFDNTWEFDTNAVRPSLQGMNDDGLAVVADIPLMVLSVDLAMGAEPGELDVSISLSADADVYYIVIPKDSTAPTSAEVKAGVDYGSVVVEGMGSAMATSELAETVAFLTPQSEYTVYVYAETTDEQSDVVMNTEFATSGTPLWGGTDPDTEGHYQIHNLFDLETYRNLVNSDTISRESTVKLMVDLDMSVDYGPGESQMSWEPIGNSSAKWKGTFDGNGHSITGLYINEPDMEYVGLFGLVEGSANIKNLVLMDVNVTGKKYVGALVGYAKGEFTNLAVVGGTVSGTERVGGLIGRFAQDGLISKAMTNVVVTGSSKYVGGIVGHADYTSHSTDKYVVIEDVYSLSNVTGTTYVGGIVGYLRGELSRAAAFGAITATDSSGDGGGVAGYVQNSSKQSPAGAKIMDVIAANDSIIIPDSYGVVTQFSSKYDFSGSWDGSGDVPVDYVGLEPVNSGLFGLDTLVDGGKENGTDVTLANIIDSAWFTTNLPNWNFTDTWEIKVGAERPTLKDFVYDDTGLIVIIEPDLDILVTDLDTGDNPGELDFQIKTNKNATIYYVLVVDGAVAPTAAEVMAGVNYGSETVISAGNLADVKTFAGTITSLDNGTDYVIYAYASVNDETDEANDTGATQSVIPLWGGTDPATEGYYQIHNLADLEAYRDLVNANEVDGIRETTAKLMADIDMSSVYGVGLDSWDPIGNSSAKWKGTFDGQGFTIDNLYVDDAGNDYQGLFGLVEGSANIKNLTLTNVNITGKKYVGALVGYGKGEFTDLVVDGGTVTGTERVGGLIGRFAQDGLIARAWTDVTVVSSGKYAGGVVGHADYTSGTTTKYVIIEDVYSLGDTTATTYVGGIVGYLRGTLQRAIAYGAVTATDGSGDGAGVAGYIQNSSKQSPEGAKLVDVIAANSSLTFPDSYGRVTYKSSKYDFSGSWDGSGDVPAEYVGLDPTMSGLFALDTLTTAGTKENGNDVTAAQLADSTWWTTNLSSWDFTNTWELVNGLPYLK